MFIIKWRTPLSLQRYNFPSQTITGCLEYSSREAAERQVERFKNYWPNNLYYVEQLVDQH